MPEIKEGDHGLESDTCPENQDGKDGLARCENAPSRTPRAAQGGHSVCFLNYLEEKETQEIKAKGVCSPTIRKLEELA